MALCCAHTAAGYLAYEAVRPAGPHQRRLLAAAVALANAPDLDFVPGLVLGHPGMFHRGAHEEGLVPRPSLPFRVAAPRRPGVRP